LDDQRLVETARCAVVDVLDTGILLELGLAQARLQPPVLAFGQLAVGQSSEALLEAEGVDVGYRHLLVKGLGHPGQA
jgi:hypothetical protein